ncbi:MAG: universal stress protein [Actinomycetota bacterium]
MFQQIIVPLDGSPEAAEALGPASAMARRVGAPMHVIALHSPGHDATELEQTVLAQADTTGDVVRIVEVRPIEVDVATDLIRLTTRSGPALIVMATHARGRSAAVFGSVAADVLAVAGQPVMLIGPNVLRSSFRTHGPAIVAVDGHEDSEVLSLTATLLADTDFHPVVANVVDPREAKQLAANRGGPGGFDLPNETAVAHRAAEHLRTSSDLDSVDYDVFHDEHPGDAIVAQANERRASLIVMTTHARRGLDRLTTGSVAAEVVRDAPCPVLVAGLDA